ncbi:MAG: quinol:cytochrome C oxidoreductase, partial [Bacteroidetes bacterium]|nr:quinol:cytochrome C oxidoreductase [Bacteroidota bacterium]
MLIAIGLGTFVYAFISNPAKAWANYLVNNYYFLSLAVGASFFYAIQYITQSGWSSGFKRVPEAMFGYLPVAALFFVLLFFGMHYLYEWSHHDVALHDELIAHKSPYLNVPFFFIRLFVFFAAWILLTQQLRKLSLREDKEGGMVNFQKSELYSKIFIFILGVTFSMSVIDWIKSIEVHWFSTLFALKGFISAFLHGTAAIVFIVLLLSYKGYFPFLNGSHLHDFNRYMFILSIFYGYFWFSQFMLIWYAN